VGGEAAVREPWRVAVAALVAAGADDLIETSPISTGIDSARLRSVASLAGTDSWPRASGAGRVFEAAGALLGVALENRYEGEAAAKLEALAATSGGEPEVFEGVEIVDDAPIVTLPSSRLLEEVARRLAVGGSRADIAAGFHATFCSLAAEITERVAGGEHRVVSLGGGCLVNRLLGEGLSARLHAAGHEVLLPCNVPPGDGGLSYGQAVVAVVSESRGVVPMQLTGEEARTSGRG
jgi:hydrogenase maturation protein HypF